MHGRVCVWQGVFMGVCVCGGGMHGRVACMAGGHVWQGACMAGGMHGRGCAWQKGWGMHGRGCVAGVCIAGGMHGGGMHGGMHGRVVCVVGGVYGYEIWSMSRQYASYWNVFLFTMSYYEYLTITSSLFSEKSSCYWHQGNGFLPSDILEVCKYQGHPSHNFKSHPCLYMCAGMWIKKRLGCHAGHHEISR